MKTRILTCIALMSLFVALVASVPATGQDGNNLSSAPPKVHYVVKDLGTFGGAAGVAEGISDRGWVVGDANLADNLSVHAFLWRDGVMTDLGTLGGMNSQEQWPVKDNQGLIVGSSETSQLDPFNEDFCGFDSNSGVPPTGLICQAFLWKDGEMTALPTLGGNNAQALGANNLGQIVGFAEQSTQFQNCSAPQILDIQAVVWGPNPGEVRTLAPLQGDVSTWAIGINDAGQIIGLSGNCVSPNFNASPAAPVPQHGVIWQNGTVTNIGTLGGSFVFPWAINSKGQVVGQSTPPGTANIHTFIWQTGIMTDLGVLPGDVLSGAFGLNDKGDVVGGSCGPLVTVGFCRAFLWQNGVMTDLNSLVIPGSSSLYLVFGNDINSRGEIAAYAFDQNTGAFHAALAIPCDDDGSACTENTTTLAPATGGSPKVSPPKNVRKLLQKRMPFGPL